MPFSDPNAAQNPTTGLVAPDAWGDAVDASFNFLRGAKAGCHLTSVVGTAITTDTVLPWATELYDVNACHDNVTNNSRITVPATWGGLWFIGVSLRCTFTGGGTWKVSLVVNGTTRICESSANAASAADSQHCCETIYVLAAGDYVEVWATGGSARSTAVASRFYAHWQHSGA